MITNILQKARISTGFNATKEILLIEVFPSKENGCIIYFSKINNKIKKKQNSILKYYVFEYSNLDNLIMSATRLFKIHGHKILKSSLYTDLKTKKYFLLITVLGDENKDIVSLLKEFALLKSQEKLFHLIIDEHCKNIIKDNALETIYNYFI